jgi:Tfp pilus assembly protein PilV
MGFSLIEVVVSLLLISSMLLCVFQNKIKINHQLAQAFDKQSAIQQTLSIIERLKVNKSTQYVLREIAEWQQETAGILPHGEANLSYKAGHYVISIKWIRDGQQSRLTKIMPVMQ